MDSFFTVYFVDLKVTFLLKCVSLFIVTCILFVCMPYILYHCDVFYPLFLFQYFVFVTLSFLISQEPSQDIDHLENILTFSDHCITLCFIRLWLTENSISVIYNDQ